MLDQLQEIKIVERYREGRQFWNTEHSGDRSRRKQSTTWHSEGHQVSEWSGKGSKQSTCFQVLATKLRLVSQLRYTL